MTEMVEGGVGASESRERPQRERGRFDFGRRRTIVIAVIVVVVVIVAGAGVAIVATSGDSSGALVDTFTRSDRSSGLGQAPDGLQWNEVLGRWGISGDEALVVEPDVASNVVVAATPGVGTVQVKLSHVVDGAGLVFRYQSPSAYWEIVAFRRYLSWQINKVVDGKATYVANTGTYSPVNGSVTVAVRDSGGLMDISLNGQLRRTLSDDYLASATGAGLVANGPDAANARFARFAFTEG